MRETWHTLCEVAADERYFLIPVEKNIFFRLQKKYLQNKKLYYQEMIDVMEATIPRKYLYKSCFPLRL